MFYAGNAKTRALPTDLHPIGCKLIASFPMNVDWAMYILLINIKILIGSN